MSDISLFTQLPLVLKDWIPESASIAVANEHQYVAYRPGECDLHISPGDEVRPGSIADYVFTRRERVELEVDSSVFGIPYHGLGYPLQTDGGLDTAVTVILPPTQPIRREPLSLVMGQDGPLWRAVPVTDIVYFESFQKKTWLYTENQAFTTGHTLQSLEDCLPSRQFLRIHRSFIVNIASIDYIQRDDRSHLVMKLRNSEQTRLPVAQTYVKHVRDYLGF